MKCLTRSRWISLLLSLMIVIGLCPVSVFATQSDTTAPVLNSVQLSAASVNAPGSIEVTVDATDDFSSVGSVYVRFTCDEVNKSFGCDAVLREDGMFCGVLEIGEDALSGAYQIDYICVEDEAGNWKEYSKDVTEEFPWISPMPAGIKGLQFLVVGEELDTTPPVLNGIILSDTNVKAPGSLEVTVDASDDLSGVESVRVKFTCEEVAKSFSCDARVGADGKFHGNLTVGEDALSGAYVISYVYLEDAAGNWQEYSKNVTEIFGWTSPMPIGIKDLKIDVAGEEVDTTPPVLNGVSLSSGSVNASGSIEVTVDAQDDLSGIKKVYVRFRCEEVDKAFGCDAILGEDGKFHGILEITEEAPAGKYLLSYVSLDDSAGNWQEYTKDVSETYGWTSPIPEGIKDLHFAVMGKEADTIPPVLMGISLSAESVTVPGSIEVIVDARDDISGIDKVHVIFNCEEEENFFGCDAILGDDGKFHGVLEIEEGAPVGTYQISYISLDDKAGNRREYTKDVTENYGWTYPIPADFANIQFSLAKKSENEVTRVFGADRYATSFKSADTLKEELGVEKFSNIIVASGTGFADALAGSYLAAVKNAPILLVRGANVNDVKDYIKANLTSGGTVYLLGGVNAVPQAMESGLDGFNVKRLGGADRYETNLLILNEAGVGDKDVIVCTGLNFADSLSASASGLPILLVKGGLTDAQKTFLASSSGKKIIVGGTAAVSAAVESQLKAYGEVKRLAGNTRYDTSVLVAKEFFDAPTSAVLAYAQNFPDGLSGGPLAYALKAPLILTDSKKPTAAVTYATGFGIKSGYVLGGSGLISDEVVKNIFSMAENEMITAK